MLCSLLLTLATLPALRYDQAHVVSTHNSYWAQRRFELGASGSNERVFDQLAYEGVRAIELDIHPRAHEPGVWGVFHTDAEANSVCTPLSACLDQVRLYHYANPQHPVLNVIVELKALWGHAFDGEHAIAALDASLRAAFGDALFTPRQLLARCPPGATLRSCARDAGWPAVDELRGRIIVNVLGNWRHSLDDWVGYATSGGGVGERVAFPMRTILSPQGLTRFVGRLTRHRFDAATWQAALDASIFWQVGDGDFAELPRFLDEHGIVRSPLASPRFQMAQTDEPWRHAQPPMVTSTIESHAQRDEWQTAPALSAHASGIGCLQATSRDGRQAYLICKRVLAGAVLRVSKLAWHDGVVSARALDGGDLLSLTIERAGAGSCVVAATAARIVDGEPAWRERDRDCFSAPLVRQGPFAGGGVGFVGTRHRSSDASADKRR